MNKFVYYRSILAGLLCVLVMSPLAGGARPDWADSPVARGRKNGATPCNWLEVYAHFEGSTLRFAYRCAEPIDFTRGAAYTVFFDTDAQRDTGFRGDNDFPIGADYMLQGSRLYRYVGDEGPQAGLEWAWTALEPEAVEASVDGEWAEFTLCMNRMLIRGHELRFFLYGDNLAEDIHGNFNDILPARALQPRSGGRHLQLRVPDEAHIDP